MDSISLAKSLVVLMLFLRPESPFRETFEKTAAAIAKASIRTPVFPGSDGPAKTGYLAVAVADFESGFQPDAEGDCDKTTKEGTCVKGSKPHSFCLLQVNESNFKGFRTTRTEIQSDIDVCVTVGIAMMKQSFGIARSLPVEEKLRWYAGGPGWRSDDAGRKSKHRVTKALWLFKEHPPAVVESAEEAREE